VFPLDKIPKIRLGGLVVNTDPSYFPGEHWIAIYIKNHIINVYDPLGLYYPSLLKQKLKGKRNVIYNKTQNQSIDENTCGEYCLLWLTMQNL
jgi:hypothetical protein